MNKSVIILFSFLLIIVFVIGIFVSSYELFPYEILKSIKNNLIVREEILKKMKSHLTENPNNHNDWQKSLINFNKLREEFKNVGYIPNKDGKLLWKNFRDHSKSFLISKNEFYKTPSISRGL